MNQKNKNFLSIIIFLFLLTISFSTAEAAWYRGNSHNHFDGKNLEAYRDDYRNAGYDFIVAGDHDYANPPQCSVQEGLSVPGFLVLCGVEMTAGGKHTGAFGINNLVVNTSNVQDAVNKALAEGGVPVKNHPVDKNNNWTASDFLAINNLNHFELANGGRMSQIPAAENFWDDILSTAPSGRTAYAIGSDDNHGGSPLGRAWIMVQANSLSKQEIINNFRNGNFYASTGVTLSNYQVNYTAKTINISSDGNSITFIGNNGATLKTVSGGTGLYQYTGTAAERYVRAKVEGSSGAAWTQPVYFSGTPPPSTPTPTGGCQPGTVPGDANGDCKVDGFDYVIWWQNFNKNVSGYANGDFNNSGLVDGFDYVIWWQNFGT